METTPTETTPVETITPQPPTDGPIQVDETVFLAARLREVMAEAANLRQVVAELQVENSRLRAIQDQAEISRLDSTYDVGAGTVLQKRADGTYWRLPQQQPAT